MSDAGKKCFKCGVAKPLSDFYRHRETADGYLGKCKACAKRDVRTNYRRKWPQKTAYERARWKTPQRRQSQAIGLKKHRERHPDRYKARMAVGNAIRDGRLKKLGCEWCGTTTKVQAHHDDYSKPFEVRWICRRCHLFHHGKWSTDTKGI